MLLNGNEKARVALSICYACLHVTAHVLASHFRYHVHTRERITLHTGRWELPGGPSGVRPHGLDRYGAQASPQEASAGAAEAHPAVSRRAVDGEQRQKRGVSHGNTRRDSRYRHGLFSGIVYSIGPARSTLETPNELKPNTFELEQIATKASNELKPDSWTEFPEWGLSPVRLTVAANIGDISTVCLFFRRDRS